MASQLHQIKASAGSGKTYTLTGEYIRRLLGCSSTSAPGSACGTPSSLSQANEILAITFTNAAASEMRNRVLQALKESALGISCAHCADRQVAARWLNALLHDLGALNIRTIDSLMHLIIRSAALEQGLPPDFEPVFDSEETLRPWLEHYLEKAAADPDSRHKLDQTIAALFDYSDSAGFTSGDKILKRLKPILEDVLTGKFDNLDDKGKSEHLPELLAGELQAGSAGFLDLAASSKLAINGTIKKSLEKYAGGDFGKTLSQGLQKSSAAEIFKKNSVVTAEIETAYADLSQKGLRYFNLAPVFKKSRLYYYLIEFLREIAVTFIRESPVDFKLPNFMASSFAHKILSAPHGVPEALCRLGSRLMHFEIDEFQDTSREQWEAIRLLVIEALAKGGSMTWVGDVKQSIYGFRHARPELFDEILRDGELLAIVPKPTPSSLEMNRRSRHNIVRHANSLFGALKSDAVARETMAFLLPQSAPEHVLAKAARRLTAIYADVEQQMKPDNEGGYVRCEGLEPEGDRQEGIARRAVELVLQMRRPYADICILTRTNDHAKLLAQKLLAVGVPVITENSLLLSEHPVIIQLLAFLRFLRDPHDPLAFWTLLLGPVFLDHPMAGDLDKNGLLRMQATAPLTPEVFREKYARLWEKGFGPFLGGSRVSNAYDAVMEWIARMDIQNRFPEDKTYIRRFMEVLHQAGRIGHSSIADFLDYWQEAGIKEKTPMPESMDAVRIMTIHKAKGLQAPVIIVPWTSFPVKPPATPQALTVDGLRIPAVVSEKSAPDLYYEHMTAQAVEAMNLFYVAVTRPEEELYILIDQNEEGRNNLSPALRFLYGKAGLELPLEIGENPDRDKAPRKMDRQAAPLEKPGLLREQPDEWAPMKWLDLRIFGSRPDTLEMTASERGTFLHFCLQYMRISGNPHDDAERALAYGLAHSTVPVPDETGVREELLASLQWFASLRDAGQWLAAGWPEQPLADRQGNILRADLIVPRGDGALVIDYKSGEPRDEHVAQVRAYLDCLVETGRFGGELEGLLVYLDQKKFRRIDSHGVSELSGGEAQ